MKKRLLILVAFILAAGLSLGAQSLIDNPDYQKSVQLNAMAKQAYDDGDYDAAAQYAAQAKDFAALSDKYVDKQLADKEMATAKASMAWADGINAKATYPDKYQTAADLYASAQSSYSSEDYPTATDDAKKTEAAVDQIAAADADVAIAQAKTAISAAEATSVPKNYPKEYATATTALADAIAAYDSQDYGTAAQRARAAVAAVAGLKAVQSWPAVYVVRLIPARRDCLWRIAEYPFIYNNPLKWTVIYDANKKTFRDPGNPNLIFPGQKLKIPAIKGETREGTYDPNTQYEAFPKK